MNQKYVIDSIVAAAGLLVKTAEIMTEDNINPTFEDVIAELRILDCGDEEIAYWLTHCDPKLGAIPLDLIQEGCIEGVYRRLRNGKA